MSRNNSSLSFCRASHKEEADTGASCGSSSRCRRLNSQNSESIEEYPFLFFERTSLKINNIKRWELRIRLRRKSFLSFSKHKSRVVRQRCRNTRLNLP